MVTRGYENYFTKSGTSNPGYLIYFSLQITVYTPKGPLKVDMVW